MEEFILSHGSYLAVIVLLAMTGAGLPIPEEVIIVAAGVLSSEAVGKLDPTLALISCLVGAIVGDGLMYWIGRGLGKTFLREHRIFARLLHAEREAQMERVVSQHGIKVFLIARFLVGVRAPIYLAMGIMRVDFRRFVISDAICASVVVSLFFWLSYFFGGWVGERIRESQQALTGCILIGALGAAIYYFVWKKCRQQLQIEDTPDETPADASLPS